MRLLIMTPSAFLDMLERAAQGEAPEDLMMLALDEASQNQVQLTIEPEEDLDN
jgi:hypothetical protein